MKLASVIFCIMGLVFFTGGAVGILRMPDFYSRLHPAGKLDTLASLLIMMGLAIYNLHNLDLSAVLTSLKMLLIVVFIFLSNPTATHGIVDAGLRAGHAPWRKDGRKG